jgi:Uma2 family endonuclease
MTADEFLVWSQAHGDARYELVAGEVVAMAPERFAHADAKAEAWLALRNAIAAAGLPCRAHLDGAGLRVDDRTLYIPDVMVRCGPPPPPDARETDDAVIVVEVLSPSTEWLDVAAKLEDYFRVPSVAHYLILRIESGAVIHHARAADGTIVTAIRREGSFVLDPPGLTLEVAALFGGG